MTTPARPATAGGRAGNMVRVAGGQTFVGTDTPEIAQDGEGPERPVVLADYALEAETVTVERFAEFVAATGYRTEAEMIGWSAVFFSEAAETVPQIDQSKHMPWWHRVDRASWWHPEGPGSSVENRSDHPVTHVSWNDANAFAAWTGGRLPSEAEWEHAARGGAVRRRFPWGDDEPDDITIRANIWQGKFPAHNLATDGYERTAPARTFSPNPLGFYNMSGNVWEWCGDPFRVRGVSRPARLRNAQSIAQGDLVLKGGSFLCHRSYCYRYRIVARMGLPPDSSTSNAGFRVAYDL